MVEPEGGEGREEDEQQTTKPTNNVAKTPFNKITRVFAHVLKEGLQDSKSSLFEE